MQFVLFLDYILCELWIVFEQDQHFASIWITTIRNCVKAVFLKVTFYSQTKVVKIITMFELSLVVRK